MTSTGFHPGNVATTASAAVLALLMASCSSDAPDGAPNSGAPSTANDEPAPSAPVSIPDTAVGEVTDHVLEVVNSDQDSTAEDWEGLLSESFRSEVDETQLAEVLNQSILPGSPWTATEYQGTETQSTTRVEGSAGELNLVLQIDADDQVVALFWQWVAPGSRSTRYAGRGFFNGHRFQHTQPGCGTRALSGAGWCCIPSSNP
ncbi:hypothetical protein FEF26_02955 [Nesterenkonia salmonea]|uniref:ORF 12 gene product N-terminal domain-containing protein n=1 Tax=Nesterenkonia salmonea TaxID=1804987 RepID=A0A5R9BFW6_9MICC|nr:Cpe/LpqF family protein [Nesterenkonia salmonea]TLP99577.1 hypothetical protein FEF26_02955 [Nesterenkonia salmonea]